VNRIVRTAVIAAILVAALLAAYAGRRSIAGVLVEHYLAKFGLPSKVDVTRLDLDEVVADVRLPDVSGTLRASIAWAGLTPSIRSLHVTSTEVRARFDGRHLSLGDEDRLVDFILNRPRHGTPPDVTVDGARVRVDSPRGRVELTVSAALEAGVPRTLRVTLLPGELRSTNLAISFRGGTARVESNSDGLDVKAEVTARVSGNMRATPGRVERLKLSLDGSKLKFSTSEGLKVEGHLKVSAEGESLESGRVAAVRVAAAIDAPEFRLDGSWPNLQSDIRADLNVRGLSLPIDSGTGLIPEAEARLAGAVKSDSAGPRAEGHLDLHLVGGLSDGMARRLLRQVPLLGSDPHNLSTLVTAIRSAVASAAGVGVTYSPGHIGLTLEKAVSLSGANGVRMTLEPHPPAGLLEADTVSGKYRGAFELAVAGGGAPSVSVAVPSYSLGAGRDGSPTLEVRWALAARLSAAPLRRLSVTAAGSLHAEGGSYRVFMDDCAQVSLGELALGSFDAVDLKTQLCGARAPWLVFDERRWALHAMWRDSSARLPAANTSIADTTGGLDLSGDTRGVSGGGLKLTSLQLTDASGATRFAPLSSQGKLTLKDRTWAGALDVQLTRGAHTLGRIDLRHSLRTGTGEARIQVSGLEFSPGGLQPSMLSSLLQPLARAHGRTGFDGAFSWKPGRLSSGGVLRLENWGFSSAVGEVSQVDANVELTSLLPLQSAPHQMVSVGKIDAVLPLTGMSGHFELMPTALNVEDARMNFAGGTIMLGPATIPFDPKASMSATVRLQDIDLNKVVAATSLADRLKLDVRVSGTIPFSKSAAGVKVTQGFLSSTGPGRIEISRRIWSADAEKEQNAIRDFAYQALEHLAVDELDGTINSLPEGRLGIVLRVRGRHDPAVAVPTRIGIVAFLRGHAFDKPLPLPKGTPIDLTLDSSLNFEGLLDTWRAASSAVHP
jgi:hypothetical protein